MGRRNRLDQGVTSRPWLPGAWQAAGNGYSSSGRANRHVYTVFHAGPRLICALLDKYYNRSAIRAYAVPKGPPTPLRSGRVRSFEEERH